MTMEIFLKGLAVALAVSLVAWTLTYFGLNNLIKRFSKKPDLKGAPDPIVGVEAYEVARQHGYPHSYQRWLADLPRKERRAVEFANETEEAFLSRQRQKQWTEYEAFLKVLSVLEESGRIDHWSPFTFTKNVLSTVVTVYKNYLRDSEKYKPQADGKSETDNFVSIYQWLLMKNAAIAIMRYTNGKGLQAVAIDLVKMVETYYHVHGLNAVLYRHKGHIPYNDRCEGMSLAILRYFSGHVPTEIMNSSVIPLDYAPEEDLIPNDRFRKSFFQEAIDVTYSNAMKHVERNSMAVTVRKDQQEFEKNRRQRSKRLSKQNRKPRK
jgi:hypothetical protein